MCSSIRSKVETRASQINFTFFFFQVFGDSFNQRGLSDRCHSQERGPRCETGEYNFPHFFPPGLCPLRFPAGLLRSIALRTRAGWEEERRRLREWGGETADSRAMEGKAEESTRPFSVWSKDRSWLCRRRALGPAQKTCFLFFFFFFLSEIFSPACPGTADPSASTSHMPGLQA